MKEIYFALKLEGYDMQTVGELHDDGLLTDEEFNKEAEKRGFFYPSSVC